MSRTPSQSQAIEINSGNVTVTASAGSGKTSVMIDRFIRLIIEKKAEIDEVLAVTFTNLAADEMKERLADALRDKIAEGKDVEYLKRQFGKLPAANISTVDSFCNTVVKRYFYIADVDPSFAVADEIAVKRMQSSVMNGLFADLYEEKNENFLTLVGLFSSGRRDSALKSLVTEIFSFVESEKDHSAFFTKALALYTEEGLKIAEDRLIASYFEKTGKLVKGLVHYLEEMKDKGLDKYVAFLTGYLDAFERSRSEGTESALRTFFEAGGDKPKKTEKDDPFDIGFSAYFLETFKNRKLKKIRENFESAFADPRETRLYKSLEAGRVLGMLFDLVSAFRDRYTEEKRERNLLDYADLEHKTYEILKNEDAAEEIAGSFKYIFVDEYQDTNGIQEAIFSALERDNLFIVGDVKQSIYGFRGSDPSIFSDRVKKGDGKKIVLAENFRSTRAVIDAVNNVFSRVMTDASGVDYNNEKMDYGGLYPLEAGSASVQFAEKDGRPVGHKGVYGVEKYLKKRVDELTCGRHTLVRKLVEENVGRSFFDRRGRKRVIGFGDIMIVSRTAAYDDVVNELVRSGIPVSSEAEKSSADYYEISLAVDVLTTIHTRGGDDAALVSVLKSRIGGLTDGELLSIRRSDEKADFHTAAENYKKTRSDAIARKLSAAYSYIERLSLMSSVEGCGRLLSRVLEETEVPVDVLKMPCGKVRLNRLERFIGGFMTSGSDISLRDFIENKELIVQKKSAFTAGENAVRIMTIHKSKGLEAPIVIVIGTNHEICGIDKKEKIIGNRSLGIGLDYYDVNEKTREKTLIRRFIEQETYKQTTFEEERLLYVAMTRAEIGLYVVAEKRLSADSWLAPTKIIDFISPDDMEYVVRSRDEIMGGTFVTQRGVVFARANERLAEEIEKRLDYVYPHKSDVKLSLKRTVTDVNAREREETYVFAPLFKGTEDNESRGNAYHKFLELCSLDAAKVREDVTRLVASGELDAEAAAYLDEEKLSRILSLGVFDLIKGWEVYREAPFIVFVPASAVGESGESEVLLQGVIDMFAVNGDEVVIVDYKFSSKGDDALVSSYKKQLELYALAVSRALGKNVVKKFLVNVNTATAIEV